MPTESSDDHCNKTVDIYVDVSSPPVTYLNRHRPLTCWYRFKSIKGIPKDWVLRLTFKKFKVGTLINSTHCEGGYLQVSVNEFCERQKTLLASFINIMKGENEKHGSVSKLCHKVIKINIKKFVLFCQVPKLFFKLKKLLKLKCLPG